MTTSRSIIALALCGTILSGCSLAPNMKDLGNLSPSSYKEKQTQFPAAPIMDGNWQIGKPIDNLDRGPWWKIFGDRYLNVLQGQAIAANQSIKAAAARLQQARAAARAADASFFPRLDIGADASRQASSAASTGLPNGAGPSAKTLYRANGSISYEVDLLGRVSDQSSAAQLQADAADALYRQLLLALHADVAQNYFALRSIDNERKLLEQTVKLRQDAQNLIKERLDNGYSNELDYTTASTELAVTKAELAELNRQRAILENSLAILVGKPPSEFKFELADTLDTPPIIPSGLPSALLQRRPDIAAAQRQMAAANANIGVARSAFFPKLTLTASGGYESRELSDVFNWSSRTWALGPIFGTALSLPLFDGGRNFANLDLAKSGYEESVANYRQQVLVAFREVEDSLVTLRLLGEQSDQQKLAVQSSSRAVELSDERYKQGYISYLDAIDTQRSLLAAQRAAVRIQGQQYISTVDLIRALGGSWY